jgi:hypothetical protein
LSFHPAVLWSVSSYGRSREDVGLKPHALEAFDEAACEALLARVNSTEDPAWREFVVLLWPELLSFVRRNRAMTPVARSEDHVV